MFQYFLPASSRISPGTEHGIRGSDTVAVKIYRYSPESGNGPSCDTYHLNRNQLGSKLLDALMYIKASIDPSLSFRKSCREGICGSCAMNVNGRNTLVCTKSTSEYKDEIVFYPLPHLPVMRDLVSDLTNFYRQIAAVKPWLQRKEKQDRERENIQLPKERKKLDGLYECVLCACCSTSCPSYWWNSERDFLGPAALLQAYRWIADSRDEAKEERLNFLEDEMRLYRCHTIMNCTDTCPRGLNPAQAIAKIKQELDERL